MISYCTFLCLVSSCLINSFHTSFDGSALSLAYERRQWSNVEHLRVATVIVQAKTVIQFRVAKATKDAVVGVRT